MTLNKILIAEDDPDIRELVAMSLEDVGGFKVTACVNGLEVVQQARRVQPDLIILDWMMPSMNGSQALAALRADPTTGAIPVIFLTAAAGTSEVAHMRELGAVDVITKPFDPIVLPDLVRQIWDGL